MLVLTRNVGERILIGDDIVVVVLGVKHERERPDSKKSRVTLGFSAPDSTVILRQEVHERDLYLTSQRARGKL